MSDRKEALYTTGEVAKLCNVSVRTVQYYDTRNILIPSELSEGGRRLYSADDVKRMKTICFLRDLGLPINTISGLFAEEHPEKVISILLEQQSTVLKEEIEERETQLQLISELEQGLKTLNRFSVGAIGDVAIIMKSKKKLRQLRILMLALAIPCEIIETGSFFYGIFTGNWLVYLAWLPVVLVLAAIISWLYFAKVSYLCPECHEVFRPNFKSAFFAAHTPTTRKLTCTCCGHTGFCVEVYREESKTEKEEKEKN
ncbi:MAG: MerR family transcriptional regulator [Lachnospiraceae bacterium]|nr:MerR family transcriptional regulator [Lachnospiraceae bacterium]